ncbi:mitochondrial large subunit ribosomal protein-domain-containing protein [Whalleya microplaca]|nr:mitochondrial large subunit ribosomal protein-domain-containing protein [Whalleya microplaca]
MLSRTLRSLVARPLAPSPLPRCFILPLHVRSLTTAPPSEPSSSDPVPPNLSTPVEAAAPTEPTEPQPKRQLPYFVGRNNLDNYGVYLKKKRGGNLKLTVLKKGEGNLLALKHDIRDALQLTDNDISLNSVTGHIVIRGSKRDEVLNFLHIMGF